MWRFRYFRATYFAKPNVLDYCRSSKPRASLTLSRTGATPASVDREEVSAIKRVIELDAKIEPCPVLQCWAKS